MSEQLQDQVLDRATALSGSAEISNCSRKSPRSSWTSTRVRWSDIHTALATGDASALERAAHGLKGSVANFGARAAVDAAFQLEQLGKAGKLDQVPPALAALERALACLHAELSAIE